MLKLDVSNKHLKGFDSMKRLLSKTPTYIIVAVIIVLTVSLTLITAAITNNLINNNDIDNFGDLLQAMVNGNSDSDINGDGSFNILDIIAAKHESGWTTGIY